MLYFIKDRNTIYFLDEYFILLPISALIFAIAARKIKKNEQLKLKRMDEIRDLERRIRFYKLTTLGLGTMTSLTTLSTLTLAMRGGDNEMGDVSDLSCGLGSGPAVINTNRVREYIVNKFGKRAVKNIIYITVQAVCYIIRKDGVTDFPIAELRFIGLTSWLEVGRKASVMLLTGGPLLYGYYLYLSSTIVTGTAIILAVGSLLGAICMFTRNPYTISATKLSSIGALLKERIPGQIEVVYITVSDQFKNKVKLELDECALPEQAMFNKKCDISNISLNSGDILDVTQELPLDVHYGDIVGVSDVLGIPKTVLSDKPKLKLSSKFRVKPRAPRLEKFSDKIKEWNEQDPKISDIHSNLRGKIKDDL